MAFIVLVVGVVLVAGPRGSFTKRPPIEIFPDMDRQPKLRPQAPNNFFADGLSSRLPVEGTVSHSEAKSVGTEKVFQFQDHPFNTGKLPGKTNFIDLIPVPVTAQLLERGQQRFNIYCSPCHSTAGDGKGVTSKYGMAATANLHDPRIVKMADGEIFNTVTGGKNTMMGYADKLEPGDRWAVIAYVRALQRGRLVMKDEVPADIMATIKK
jgi:mono/diheme cytochrome c family protein